MAINPTEKINDRQNTPPMHRIEGVVLLNQG